MKTHCFKDASRFFHLCNIWKVAGVGYLISLLFSILKKLAKKNLILYYFRIFPSGQTQFFFNIFTYVLKWTLKCHFISPNLIKYLKGKSCPLIIKDFVTVAQNIHTWIVERWATSQYLYLNNRKRVIYGFDPIKKGLFGEYFEMDMKTNFEICF